MTTKLTSVTSSLAAIMLLIAGTITPARAESVSTTANSPLLSTDSSGIVIKSISLTPSAPAAGSTTLSGTIFVGGAFSLGGTATPTQSISVVVPGGTTSVTTKAQLTPAECSGEVCVIKKITNDPAPVTTQLPTVSPLPAVNTIQSNQPLNDVAVPVTPPMPLKIESNNISVLAPAETTPPTTDSEVNNTRTPLTFTKKLGVGSRGSEVVMLQEFLIRNEFLKTTATGYFGNITKTAISNFQKVKKLKPTGRLDTATMNYLAKNGS